MGLKDLVFILEELPLWNVATTGEAIQDPSMIEVELCSMKPEVISTTLAPPLFSAIKPQPNITKILNLHIQGALEQLQQTSPTTSMPVSQHSTPRRKLPSAALGALPPTRVEDPLDLEEAGSSMPSQWSLPHRHCSMQPHLMTSSPLSQLVIHHPHLLCQNLQLWPAFPPFHSLRFTLGADPFRGGNLIARGNEHGHGAATHN